MTTLHGTCVDQLEKQPNASVEVIEEEIKELRSPATMDRMEAWLKERPKAVQEMARKFPHYQMYLVKKGAPYRFTGEGCVVAVYSFVEGKRGVELRCRVLRSPIGYAGVIAEIDPEYLEPITLDDLKEMVKGDPN